MNSTIQHQDKMNAPGHPVPTAPGLAGVSTSERSTASRASTALMIATLGLIFYMGHRLEWKIPKFSELAGKTARSEDDWCKEHNVPESICVNCRTELMPKTTDHGWCMLHGVHNCLYEHPELAELKQAPDTGWVQGFAKGAGSVLSPRGRKSNNSRCKNYLSRVQFASIQAVEQAGVEVEPVETGSIQDLISGNGEIVYDPARTATLASRQPGSIFFVGKNIGDPVAQGEILALVDAKAVGEAKAQLLRAVAEEKLQTLNVARLQEASAAIARSRMLDADAARSKATADLINAEQTLRNLGLPISVNEVKLLEESQAAQSLKYLGIPDAIRFKLPGSLDTTNLLPIVAPIAGTVIQRDATLGQVVDSTNELFKIVDSRQMWLMLSVPLESLDKVSTGQQVRFKQTGSEQAVEGTIDWISPSADTHTRMVQVRATLENTNGQLRSNTFGSGQIVLRSSTGAITIPTQAANWEGCCHVVFVRDRHYFDTLESPKVFHVRSVRLGAAAGHKTEVLAGLLPGEVIATAGSDVLRAQLLKTGLGAGCCVED